MNKNILDKADFAKRLSEISRSFKSQADFADKIGVSVSGLKKWLYGESIPNFEQIVRISQATKVSLDWLATGEGEIYDPRRIIKELAKSPLEDLKTLMSKGALQRILDEDEELKAIMTGHYFSYLWEKEGKEKNETLEAISKAIRDTEDEPEKKYSPLTLPIKTTVSIPEIDVKAGCGGGGIPQTIMKNGIETDAIKSTWTFPKEYLKTLLINPNDLRILEINGDSMMPTLLSGEKVFINIADKNPSPSGIFALWDGFGCVVKRIERIPNKKETIRVISDNKAYSPYELTAEEANIIGRVVCYIRRC